MEKPIIRRKGSYCFDCEADTIIAYDTKDRAVPYVTRPNTTLEDIKSSLNNTTLSYMKCSKCGKKYLIDYSLGYARPVSGSYIRNDFFSF